MVESDGELEGVYRFLGNGEVEPEAILAPHFAATLKRARNVPLCLVVHDTTEFKFSGYSKREGLGFVTTRGQGFFGHFSMAVLPGPTRMPLGICGLERISRQIKKGTIRKPHSHYTSKDPNRETLRWHRALRAIEEQREGLECIHVMDREADMFDLMSEALDLEARFIIRGDKERALVDGSGLVEDLLATLESRTTREASLAARIITRRHQTIAPKPGSKSKQRHAPRAQRTATLSIGATSVEFRRPRTAHSKVKSLKVNLVHVWEEKPPIGEAAVDWVLFTTESIETPDDLHAIVDHYQSRWVIEEFFKALKTGCAFEKRQLESYHALSNALAVFSVVAWRLLLLRAVSRSAPKAEADRVLSATQLKILHHRLKLKARPDSAQDALFAVARLGGHIKNNGDPGWLSLGRGFEKLLLLEAGWRAAVDMILGDPINP